MLRNYIYWIWPQIDIDFGIVCSIKSYHGILYILFYGKRTIEILDVSSINIEMGK